LSVPCVLYAAKSSEDVRGSLVTQINDCRQAATAAGGREIVSEHADEAASGFSQSRGPGLTAALAEAEGLAIEHGTAELWVQHSDRLARGDGRTARHLVEVALWALKSNVVVHCVEDIDTFRDLLNAVVTGQRNHEDSQRKGAASAAGIKRATLRGEYVGQPLDGYRVVVSADERGRVTKHLEIASERDALFRMIFRMAKRGVMPSEIARRANKEGWTTVPRRRDNRPGAITPTFIQATLCNPRYAGLAAYKGEIVGLGQWPAYISPREHKRLNARVRRHKRPALPRQPFLLARLASCGLCGGYMITLAGKPRKDGTRRRSYVCVGRRTGRCDLGPLNARAIDHVMVASLNRFLGGLEETEPYRPSPGFPRELIRGHAAPSWEAIEPIATVTAELRASIGQALRNDEHELAERLLEELIEHRERLRASMSGSHATRRGLSLELSEEPTKLLFDFYAWSANDLAGRLVARPQDTERLNRVLRRWFSRVVLRPRECDIEIAPVLAPPSASSTNEGRKQDPAPAYADPDHWQVALRIAGYGHRYGERWGEAEILHALRTWAGINGRAPHIQDWEVATPEHPYRSVVIDRFGRWNAAIEAAGLTPAQVPRHTYKVAGRYARLQDSGPRQRGSANSANCRRNISGD
jgi:DNA invertase Pin-like site-specific DNA recombinase